MIDFYDVMPSIEFVVTFDQLCEIDSKKSPGDLLDVIQDLVLVINGCFVLLEQKSPLIEAIMERLPEGEGLYPKDQITNLDPKFWHAELIREKLFLLRHRRGAARSASPRRTRGKRLRPRGSTRRRPDAAVCRPRAGTRSPARG